MFRMYPLIGSDEADGGLHTTLSEVSLEAVICGRLIVLGTSQNAMYPYALNSEKLIGFLDLEMNLYVFPITSPSTC